MIKNNPATHLPINIDISRWAYGKAMPTPANAKQAMEN